MTSFAVTDPRVVKDLNAVSRAFVPPAQAQTEGVSFSSVLGAAFQQENIIASMFTHGLSTGTYDPDFDPFEVQNPGTSFHPTSNPFVHISGFEDFTSDFITARNREDTERIKRQITRELKNRSTLADAGALGIVGGTVAAILDPLIFVPFGAAAKGVRGISSVRTALKFAAVGAGVVGTQEYLLHQTQQTRTLEESALNVTGATILSGILGGAIGQLSARQFSSASKQIDNVIRAMGEAEPPKPGTAAGIDPVTGKQRFIISIDSKTGKVRMGLRDPLGPEGIEVSPQGSLTTLEEFAKLTGDDLTVAKGLGWIPGFKTVSKWISPRLQPFMSKEQSTRQAANQIMQSPVRLEGGAKALDAESVVRIKRAEARQVAKDVDDLYAQYATGDPRKRMTLTNRVFGFRREPGRLTYAEFQEEISKAMRGRPGADGKAVPGTVDAHEIPEVAAAAKLQRERVINPIRDELIELGIFPEDTKLFPGYLTRMYNHDLLRKVEHIAGKPRMLEQEALIDSIVAYEQKVALTTGKLEQFSEARLRVSLRKALDQILSIPEGRLFPGDISLRGPMLSRTLRVPDAIIERWLVNDNERIIQYYVRSLSGDIELIKRFGLVRARVEIEAGQKQIIASIRAEEKTTKAIRFLRERDNSLAIRFGGERMRKNLAKGRRSLNSQIRKSKTDTDALSILQEHDKEIIQRWSSGNVRSLFDRIETAYAPKIKDAEKRSSSEARKLMRERARDIANLRLARDEVRSMASIPADPTHLAPRVLRGARQWTYMATGGTVTLSSIPDVGLPIFNKGIGVTFRNAIMPLISDLRGLRLGIADARLALGPSELITNLRSSRLFDVQDDFRPRTRLERGLNKLTHKYSIANLMAPWNETMRNFSALTTMGFVVESASKVARGIPLKPKIKARLDELGLSEPILKRINAQFDKHAMASRPYAPNVSVWDDEIASLSMKSAVERSSNLDVIKGGPLDRPTIVRNAVPGLGDELSKTIFMYMNFGLSANTRILGRALQYQDAIVLSGMLSSVGFGMLAVFLKWKAKGPDAKPPAETPFQWIAKSVEQSGISGAIFDFDRYIETATGGKVGVSALLGTKGSRYYSPQSVLGAVFGAPVGKATEALTIIGGISDLDPQASDVRRFRRLIILNNHFLLRQLFDSVEDRAEQLVE